ncbi:hypothetical protein DFJ73DRAFT_848025 [Zopfochytrium polystomum]|nr:hypothetical protein DFJ73DRAFT_848025 [Zopfochytrium polystomum]
MRNHRDLHQTTFSSFSLPAAAAAEEQPSSSSSSLAAAEQPPSSSSSFSHAEYKEHLRRLNDMRNSRPLPQLTFSSSSYNSAVQYKEHLSWLNYMRNHPGAPAAAHALGVGVGTVADAFGAKEDDSIGIRQVPHAITKQRFLHRAAQELKASCPAVSRHLMAAFLSHSCLAAVATAAAAASFRRSLAETIADQSAPAAAKPSPSAVQGRGGAREETKENSGFGSTIEKAVPDTTLRQCCLSCGSLFLPGLNCSVRVVSVRKRKRGGNATPPNAYAAATAGAIRPHTILLGRVKQTNAGATISNSIVYRCTVCATSTYLPGSTSTTLADPDIVGPKVVVASRPLRDMAASTLIGDARAAVLTGLRAARRAAVERIMRRVDTKRKKKRNNNKKRQQREEKNSASALSAKLSRATPAVPALPAVATHLKAGTSAPPRGNSDIPKLAMAGLTASGTNKHHQYQPQQQQKQQALAGKKMHSVEGVMGKVDDRHGGKVSKGKGGAGSGGLDLKARLKKHQAAKAKGVGDSSNSSGFSITDFLL